MALMNLPSKEFSPLGAIAGQKKVLDFFDIYTALEACI